MNSDPQTGESVSDSEIDAAIAELRSLNPDFKLPGFDSLPKEEKLELLRNAIAEEAKKPKEEEPVTHEVVFEGVVKPSPEEATEAQESKTEEVSEELSEKIVAKGKELGVQVLFEVDEKPRDEKENIYKQTLEFLESLSDEEKLKLAEDDHILIGDLAGLEEIIARVKKKEETAPEIKPAPALELEPEPKPESEPIPAMEPAEPVAETPAITEIDKQEFGWFELNGLLGDLNIDFEFNEEHLKKFEEKNPNADEKYREIKEAIESFPNKERLREKFSTIRLGWPKEDPKNKGYSNIFIEDNKLFIDLGISKQEIMGFLGSLVAPEKEDVAQEQIKPTDSFNAGDKIIWGDKEEIIKNNDGKWITLESGPMINLEELKKLLKPAPEAPPTSQEKSELALKIENAQSFDELYQILSDTGGIQGSDAFYSSENLIENINSYRKSPVDIILSGVTRSEGLRDKVRKLVQNQPPIAPEPKEVPEIKPEPAAVAEEENIPEWKKGEEWKKFEQLRIAKVGIENDFKKGIVTEEYLDEVNVNYENTRNSIGAKIAEGLRKEAGENLTPEQEAELKSKINDESLEFLRNEHKEYKKVFDANREKTVWDKTKEAAKSVLNTKAMQWYLRQNKWARLAITTTLFTVGGYAIGTAAVGGTILSAAGYGVGRGVRGAASILGGNTARVAAEKYWTEEKIDKEFKDREEKIKNSQDSFDEKSKKFTELKAWEENEKKWIKIKKSLVTVGVGAGAGILAGLTEGTVSGKGLSSTLESKGGKMNIQEHRLSRKSFEPAVKPKVSEQVAPPKPVAPEPTAPKSPVTPEPAKPVTPPAEKLFSDPSVLKHEAIAGNSTWKLLEKTLDSNDRFKGMDGAQKTYVISAFTNKVMADPTKYGLHGNGSLMVTDKVDFTELFKDVKGANSIIDKAEHLSDGQIKSITENNAKILEWVKAHPKATLNESKVSEILSGKPKVEVPVEPTPKISVAPEAAAGEIIKEPETPGEGIHKVTENYPHEEPVIAGGAGMAGITAAGILERERKTREEIEAAKKRLGELTKKPGSKVVSINSRNPNLERTLVSDSQSQYIQNMAKFSHDIVEAFERTIDRIYGKKGILGMRRKEGVKTKEWQEIDGFMAKELVQYIKGESERQKLSQKFLKTVESPKNQQFIKELNGLMDDTGWKIEPREKEKPSEFVMRLADFITKKQPQMEILQKAA